MAETLDIAVSTSNALKTALADKMNAAKEPEAKRYKAVVQSVDENSVTWVSIIGGAAITPVVEMQITAKRGDVIDIEIENGRARGLSSGTGDSQAVTVGLMAVLLDGLSGTVSSEAFQSELSAYESLFVNNFAANDGFIQNFESNNARIGNLQADYAAINKLVAKNARIEKADIEKLNAEDATIKHLIADDATIEALVTKQLESEDASIVNLIASSIKVREMLANDITVDNLLAGKADIDLANIDVATISVALVQQFFARSGWIDRIVAEDGTVTGELKAVKIDANVVEVENIKANSLWLRNDADGLYYALNVTLGGIEYSEAPPEMQAELQSGLHGDNIIAGTITADKIYVSDLAAFRATIAGMVFGSMTIGEDEYYTMHTVGRDRVNSNAPGIYLDGMGQFSVGDGDSHIMLYKDPKGNWKIDMATDQLTLGGQSVASTIQTLQDRMDNMPDQKMIEKSGEGSASFVTEGAAELPLLTLRVRGNTTVSSSGGKRVLTGVGNDPETGRFTVVCDNGNEVDILLSIEEEEEEVELHTMTTGDTYLDELNVDAAGHVTVTKRVGVLDQNHRYGMRRDANRDGFVTDFVMSTATQGSYRPTDPDMFIMPESGYGQESGPSGTARLYVESGGYDAPDAFWEAHPDDEVHFLLAESLWKTYDLGYVTLPKVSDGSRVSLRCQGSPLISGSWWLEDARDVGEAYLAKAEKGDDGDPGQDGAPGQDGISIESVVQTITSDKSGGTNVITITKTDGTQESFEVMNGQAGANALEEYVYEYSSDGGILIHRKNDMHYGVRISDILEVVRGVDADDKDIVVGSFSDSVVLGDASGPHVTVSTAGISFYADESIRSAYIDITGSTANFYIEGNAWIKGNLRFDNWEWKRRENGNMCLRWDG